MHAIRLSNARLIARSGCDSRCRCLPVVGWQNWMDLSLATANTLPPGFVVDDSDHDRPLGIENLVVRLNDLRRGASELFFRRVEGDWRVPGE